MSYRRRNYVNNDPREIIVKYAGVCAETGKPLKKGDTAVYYPRGKKMFHPESRTAEDFRSQKFADDFRLGDANW